MSHQSELIASDIDAYLAQHEQKELLRFLTCGSVDDGKSTLIVDLVGVNKSNVMTSLAAFEIVGGERRESRGEKVVEVGEDSTGPLLHLPFLV